MITQAQLYDTRRMLKIPDDMKCPEIDLAIECEFDVAAAAERRPQLKNIEDRIRGPK